MKDKHVLIQMHISSEKSNSYKAAVQLMVNSALFCGGSFKIVTALNKEPHRKQEASSVADSVFVQTSVCDEITTSACTNHMAA